MPREKSAGAIIFRRESFESAQGKKSQIFYLLLHYGPGHWGFAKGHVEGNETEEETTRREVFEETGIRDLKIFPGFKEIEKYFFRQYKENVTEADRRKGKTPWVFKLVTFFVAETKTKDIKISHEHKGFVWLPFGDAIKKTTFKNSKKLLKKANDFILQHKNL